LRGGYEEARLSSASGEKDSAFLYGSEDLVDKVGDILWAADVVQETDFHQEAGVSYAISMQK